MDAYTLSYNTPRFTQICFWRYKNVDKSSTVFVSVDLCIHRTLINNVDLSILMDITVKSIILVIAMDSNKTKV